MIKDRKITQGLQLWYVISQLIATTVVIPSNFIMNKK